MTGLKIVHIIGIGGCASSAVAELLHDNGIRVSGSDMSRKPELDSFNEKNIRVAFSHTRENLYQHGKPDMVLYSPAIVALNPDNPELVEARESGIPMESWEEFLGAYLDTLSIPGFTVSGSEGKGTTAGILTAILRETELDPLSILGAKMKDVNGIDSNIYQGNVHSYILEADEYNRNFHAYHPSVNIMINFEYEHPETYSNFDEYSDAFSHFFNGMSGEKKLIFRITESTIHFAEKYAIQNIIWFGTEDTINRYKPRGKVYVISDIHTDTTGNTFIISLASENYSILQHTSTVYRINALPGYIAMNGSGAVIASLEAGLPPAVIQKNLLRFKGMVRRFDTYNADNNRVMITDYGHSPGAVRYVLNEIRSLFPGRKVHMVFQPHLYSRTFNFFNEFVAELSLADKVTVFDIYPARENSTYWKDKVSAEELAEKIAEKQPQTLYAGHCSGMNKTLMNRIHENEVTCFIGAGDMDKYYPEILSAFHAAQH